MPRSLVTALHLLLGFALLVSLWVQIVLVPTVAADEVERFPPYASVQLPLVAAAIAFIACAQVGVIALMVLLGRAGSLFQQPSLTWANVLVAAIAGGAAVCAALLVFVTLSEIPSPYDGMEVIGLWLGSAAATAVCVVLLLLTLVARHQLVKAIALRSELDEVI